MTKNVPPTAQAVPDRVAEHAEIGVARFKGADYTQKVLKRACESVELRDNKRAATADLAERGGEYGTALVGSGSGLLQDLDTAGLSEFVHLSLDADGAYPIRLDMTAHELRMRPYLPLQKSYRKKTVPIGAAYRRLCPSDPIAYGFRGAPGRWIRIGKSSQTQPVEARRGMSGPTCRMVKGGRFARYRRWIRAV